MALLSGVSDEAAKLGIVSRTRLRRATRDRGAFLRATKVGQAARHTRADALGLWRGRGQWLASRGESSGGYRGGGSSSGVIGCLVGGRRRLRIHLQLAESGLLRADVRRRILVARDGLLMTGLELRDPRM